MTRLAALTHDDLDDDQRALWQHLTTGPRADPDRPHGGLAGEDGALIGPFNALLYSPKIGDLAQELGGALRFHSSLPRDLQEIAILAIGGHWRANFEFWAHARMAVQNGVPQAAVDAIHRGRRPEFDDPRQEAAYAFADELIQHRRVRQSAYDALKSLIGERGIFDLVTTMGYYSMVSMSLNVFEVGMPPGIEPPYPD